VLRQNKGLIIKPFDKNLGPAVMETSQYIKQVLQEHLLSKDYQELTQQEAIQKLGQVKSTLKGILTTNANQLSKAENTFFKRSLSAKHRIPLFYGLPKVHKTPFTIRPVVSTTNSLLAVFSIWLDYKLKELLPLVQSCIKNSTTVINELKNIQIPENALLFSADAKSMYTNIDTNLGISTIRDFLESNSDRIPRNFPINMFLNILETVMKNNIFSFASTFWQQLSGTAMGTPVACNYATITYGHFENTVVIPRFKNNLYYYKRYINDIFGIWIPPSTNQLTTWTNFKNTLNQWG
jgi:hypothetical protein